MAKRFFDFYCSLLGISFFSPLIIFISIFIKLDSPGPVFYRGIRIGRGGTPFRIYKFRTMVADSERLGPLATPEGDPRITRVGGFLRKYKLDELPQLFNVLKGEMSLVGPRPEAPLYLEHYTENEKNTVLSIRPGITDYCSLKFHDEGKLLKGSADPVKTYLEKLKDEKVKIQMQYIREQSLWVDIKVIFLTIFTIIETRLSNRAHKFS